MGTTANNNWPTPVQTDLVKDGWEAIKDLGDAIDTTLGVYTPSTSGLTLINTTTFSAVASQSISDVFSATYKNYRVMVDLVGSTAISMTLRARFSGSDISTSIYNRQSTSANNTSVSAGRATSQTSWLLDDVNTDTNIFVMDFFNPADSGKKTNMFCMTGIRSDSATPILISNLFSTNTNSENTGFSLLPNTGTITGTAKVYGYAN
jgi:hypothetical protein